MQRISHHCIISRTFRSMSFRVDTYISPIMIRVCMNTARSKGQGQQHRRFLERSNEIMEFSINTAMSKCQKVKVKPVFPRNVSRHIEMSYVSTFLKFITHLFLSHFVYTASVSTFLKFLTLISISFCLYSIVSKLSG